MATADMKQFIIATDWNDATSGEDRVEAIRKSFRQVRREIMRVIRAAGGKFVNDGRKYGEDGHEFASDKFLRVSLPSEKAERAQADIRGVKGVLAIDLHMSA